MKISNEHILAEIRRIYNEYGKVTKTTLQHASVSYDTIKRRFGSITNALAHVGIAPTVGQRKMVSKEEVIEDILRVHKEFGYISKPLYEKHGNFNVKVVRRIFGSWVSMYEELQLQRHPSGYIPSDNELIEDLLRLQNEHGLVTENILRHFGKFSVTTYRERFGSLNKAYTAAGLEVREPGHSSHAKWVIERFAKTLGEEPIYEHRFDWLRNPKTNRHLPVDGYFPKSGIIVEYNGPQHYHIDKMYTPTEEALKYRQWLDEYKYKSIREHGYKLIVVDYRHSFTQEYINQCLGLA